MINYNYSNSFTCPKCGALNHGGFTSGGCGLCGYTGYTIHSSGSINIQTNSSASNVVGTPIQEKKISITESQFDEVWKKVQKIWHAGGISKDAVKKELGF